MIKPSCIQAVKDKLDIVTVIGHYIKLDRHNKACCPFHSEKSASFSVDSKKEIFKCFGCGEGGDAISFVMKHVPCSFTEAIEKIAAIIGVDLEYEEVIDVKAYEEQKTLQQQMDTVLSYTIGVYVEQLWKLPEEHYVRQYIRKRKLTKADVAEWQLGWAGTEWKLLTPAVINQGLYYAAEKLGIVKRSKNDDSNYDGYRSRITIPIQDNIGKYIGLGGRYLPVLAEDTGKNFPKYINPPESEYYQKSKVLFGLSRAAKSIKQFGSAFLVEGYFDVISMHKNGDTNTVGTCGTALTIEQAKILARYTNHVVLLRDGDAAGQKAAVRDLSILLKVGIKVSVAVLPAGEDPDSYSLKLDTYNNGPIDHITIEDALLWHVNNLVKAAAGDDYELGIVKEKVIELLADIPSNGVRQTYFDAICKKYKWKAADLQKQIKMRIESDEEGDDDEDNLSKMPPWMNREEFLNNGFCVVKNKKHFGYYSWGAGGKTELTNFVITPLIHIYAAKESRYMIQIDNGRQKAVLDIEAKAMVSIDLLQQYVVSEGNFIIYGSKPQMLRIANNLLQRFPRCREIEFLGWQSHGFFAFVDKIFIPGTGLKDLDEWGIIKIGENNHLIPAASAAYKQVQHSSGDPYENQRVLTYAQSPINFEQWSSLIHRVYQDKGIVAIAYTILTAFRDVIFSVDNNCPHLYGFGERSSGKSKWGESIMAFFFVKRQAFNLNSGTDYAFFNYMQIFVNCTAMLNEADEKVLKPEWFQIIKGAYDGEGRQRGVLGSKNKTEIMKIQSTLILIGQYLMTADDNSIVSRSLIESFTERELSDEDKRAYSELKNYEEKGLTSLITELIKYRVEFKALYKDAFNETLGMWRRTLNGDSANFNQRIMQNYCHLYTCYLIFSKYYKLPVSTEHFEEYCKNKAVHWSNFIRSSDTLSEFWNTFAFLVDQGIIIDGWDFKIQTLVKVKIRNEKDEVEKYFNTPTKILFLRLNNVHKHYQAAYRNRTGKEGMTIENLKHYFSGRKYYLGANKQSEFKRFVNITENVQKQGIFGAPAGTIAETKKQEQAQISSSFLFMYDHLGIDIERTVPDMEMEPEKIEEPADNLPF